MQHDHRHLTRRRRGRRVVATLAALLAAPAAHVALAAAARAQAIDCARLQGQIAAGGGRGAQAARRQANELARTQAYAHQLGCDGFVLFGGNPQCGALNNRVAQMQANLQALQAGGGAGRPDLVARFNAYCRGGVAQQQPAERGFFDQLFGALAPPATPSPAAVPQEQEQEQDQGPRRGGSQAVCVRSCDGGFFPLPISARHATEDLTQMCQALCPGTETTVFTRTPDGDIKTAVGLDGRSYLDQPNALAFQKNYSAACSCRPAGKSWAETLANAEEVLDSTRKGDIVVTPEKAAELSRPKEAVAKGAGTAGATPDKADIAPAAEASQRAAGNGDVKHPVRQVGPQP